MLVEQQVNCPYCGESFSVLLDLSEGSNQSIEDCQICCRPIEFITETDGSTLFRLDVFTGDESAY